MTPTPIQEALERSRERVARIKAQRGIPDLTDDEYKALQRAQTNKLIQQGAQDYKPD